MVVGARRSVCKLLPESFVPRPEKQNFPLSNNTVRTGVPQVIGTTDIL